MTRTPFGLTIAALAWWLTTRTPTPNPVRPDVPAHQMSVNPFQEWR